MNTILLVIGSLLTISALVLWGGDLSKDPLRDRSEDLGSRPSGGLGLVFFLVGVACLMTFFVNGPS